MSCKHVMYCLIGAAFLSSPLFALDKEESNRFGANAWNAYKDAHHLAINDAIAAHQAHDYKRLGLANTENIIACHFLTDRFAAGHIRTPRQALHDHITPSLVGDLLSQYMHDEENTYGIMVHNRKGDRWIAYGDDKNASNKSLQEALKLSNGEIVQAFMSGKDADPNGDAIFNLIPEADEVNNTANLDISPLFYWDEQAQQLERRQDLSNPYDKHWTKDWWGWSTLAELSRLKKPLSPTAQAALVRAGLGEKALQMDVITDKTVLFALKKAIA